MMGSRMGDNRLRLRGRRWMFVRGAPTLADTFASRGVDWRVASSSGYDEPPPGKPDGEHHATSQK